MSLVSSAQIEGIRRKNEFSCFCQLVTLLSPLLRAGMCWPLFPLHHGSVGSFWEVVAGFINSASCLLGQACSQLFFFPVFFLAFCGRLVRRSFLGAPPPPEWDCLSLLPAREVWGEARWVGLRRIRPLTLFSKLSYSLTILRALKVNWVFSQI